MNRTEFKKRMKSLKSYRELNPDKGYWDWKAEAFEGGGEKDSSDLDLGLMKYSTGAKVWKFLRNLFNKEHRTTETSAALMLGFRSLGNWGLMGIDPAVGSAADLLLNLGEPYMTVKTKTGFEKVFDPGTTYLLSKENQAEVMKQHGYKVIDPSSEEQPYGLVTSATNRLLEKGVTVPIYENTEGSANNVLRGNLRIIDTDRINLPYEVTKMNHAGNHPYNIYADIYTGDMYIRSWDLNDYGVSSSGNSGAASSYGNIKKAAADVLDEAGTPFVLRTGFVPFNLDSIKTNFPEFYYSIPFKTVRELIEDYFKEYPIPHKVEGGEIPPKLYERSNYQGSNDPVYVNPFTGKPLDNGAISPVLNLEDAANFTPVGNALSVRDAYTAAQNKDVLGLGLAGLGLIPFVRGIGKLGRSKVSGSYRPTPIIDRNYFDRLFEQMERATAKKRQVVDDFYKQLDKVYESIVENEDAFRKAANVDVTSGTNYIQTYSDLLRNYSKGSSRNNDLLPQLRLTEDMPMSTKAQVDPNRLDWISINSRYADPDELDPVFLRMNPGLVRHELGHIVDEKSNLDYIKKLGERSKFEPESKLKEMYPKSYKKIQDYLLNGSEIKSHMNEFREFLFLQGDRTLKETPRSMRLKLDKYKDLFKNLNILFDSYKSKKQFIKDYNSVPIVQNNQRSNKSNYV